MPGTLENIHAFISLYRRADGTPHMPRVTSAFDNLVADSGVVAPDTAYIVFGANDRLIENGLFTAKKQIPTWLEDVRPGDNSTFSFFIRVPFALDRPPLQIVSVELAGPDPEAFTIIELPDSTINPAFADRFRIRVDATDVGPYRANVIIRTNDLDAGIFAFRIRADVAEPLSTVPDLRVFGRGEFIADGERTLNFKDGRRWGGKAPGEFTIRSFALYNNSTQTLTISDIRLAEGAGHFVVFSPVPSSIAPDSEFTIQIAFVSPFAGSHVGIVEILSNDPDNAIYDFKIRGTVL